MDNELTLKIQNIYLKIFALRKLRASMTTEGELFKKVYKNEIPKIRKEVIYLRDTHDFFIGGSLEPEELIVGIYKDETGDNLIDPPPENCIEVEKYLQIMVEPFAKKH